MVLHSFNEEDVKTTYSILAHEQQTELRMIRSKYQLTKEGLKKENDPKTIHVNGQENFLESCRLWNGKRQIYVGLNERTIGGRSSKDVKAVSMVCLDIDPIRNDQDISNSTDEELKEAGITALNIQTGLEENNIYSAKSCSGNGFTIWIPIKPIILSSENKKAISEKLERFQHHMKKTYDSDRVKLDNIGDLPRIMKVPGTIALKGENTKERPCRLAHWIDQPKRVANDAFWEFVNSISVTSKLTEPKGNIPSKLTEGEINQVLRKNDDKLHRLLNGDTTGYPSKSEAEMALVCKLIQAGLGKVDVYQVMEKNSKIGKWGQTDAYNDLTYSKAVQRVQEWEMEKLTPSKLTELNQEEGDDLNGRPLLPYELLDAKVPDDYVNNPLLPQGSIVFWAGSPGSFKTLFAGSVAVAAATGKEVLGFPMKKVNVLVLNGEQGILSLKKRMAAHRKAHNVRSKRFKCWTWNTRDALNYVQIKKDEDTRETWETYPLLERVMRFIKENDIKLLIIDSWRSFFEGNEISTDEINRFYKKCLFPLRDMNICVLFLHHMSKDGAAYRGCTDIAAKADIMMHINKYSGKTFVADAVNHPGKARDDDIPIFAAKVTKREDGAAIFEKVDPDTIKSAKRMQAQKHKDFIMDLFDSDDKILSKKDIVDAVKGRFGKNVGDSTITRYLTQLSKEEALQRPKTEEGKVRVGFYQRTWFS